MSVERSIVLGLDGGGTKTVCVALPLAAGPDEDTTAGPRILGRGQQGSSNWNSVGVEAARTHCQAAILEAVTAAGATLADVAAICLGMSGVDRPEDRTRVEAWMASLLPSARALIHNDAVIALASGTGGELFGVVVISGTGMIAYGVNRQGDTRRAGGWGALLGDGGSGYAIGAAILRAVTHAADGRGPQTILLPALLAHLGLKQPEELIRWTYDDISWHRIARLAPLALEAAAQGDGVAEAILAEAAEELVAAVLAVARGLGLAEGPEPFPLVLAGNLLQAATGPGHLAARVRERVGHLLPQAVVGHPAVEPAVGAAWLARSALRGA
jgi:N-acetylglucosamine kinase-like BadF-type ATPase